MRAVIIGAGGTIGQAFIRHLTDQGYEVQGFSRADITYTDEGFAEAAVEVQDQGAPDLILITTGILHDDQAFPEKSLRNLTAENLQHLFQVNTVVPTLALKHFLPLQSRTGSTVCAALSARVGSITDNRLGGWYSYRASKAALNMIIKTASIEQKRRNPESLVVGLHPGTVESPLSVPFQANVPEGKLFTPEFSAQSLLGVLEGLTSDQSGLCFDWAGKLVDP